MNCLQERKSDLRQAFAVFDYRNLGYIDVGTFLTILTRCGSTPLTVEEARHRIERLDRRKDGRIILAELEEILFPGEEDFLDKNKEWEAV